MEELDDFVPKIVCLAFWSCRPDWRLRTHFLENNEITYIIKGKACYTIDGKSHELAPGDLLYLPDGSAKKAVTYPKSPMHCFSVSFNSLYPFFQSRPPSFPTISRIGLRKDLIDLFRNLTINWYGQQDGYSMKTRALFMLILHRLAEILIFNINSQPGDTRITKATHIIMQDYSDKLTVKDLAEQVHLTEAYFGSLFKQKKGMTVNEYIKRIRVRNAENMLQTGNYKVPEVAEYCGFNNTVHFNNSFRAVRGFSPSMCIPRSGELEAEGL